MMRLTLLSVVLAASAAAQNVHPTPPPEILAVRLTGAVVIDGRLDEEIWRTAPVADGFRQLQPNEGQPGSQRTEVRFAFDGEAIYIGARMYDSLGAAGIQRRLVRRDGDRGMDYIEVIFDTFHDHIGRLFFSVNPAGVRGDANGLGGGGDPSWDPVWEVRTSVDAEGWTAEMRIPFSQLRYPGSEEPQTWGLQIWRGINRLNELQMWSFWGLQESGGPSRFGHLTGLEIEATPERGELLPYVVGRSASAPVADPSDPFADGHAIGSRMGVDARVLLTSNLTLNLTVSPDFGQVEVDPAVVNLSAFETFFNEARPFFVEGAGYFGFGGLNCYFCSNVSSLSMFYSRRIGRQPQAIGNAFAAGPYVDAPDNTTILGAAKLTGRTTSGWSLGAMNAVTRRERATVELADGSRTAVTVEPFTNYFVGRVARDFRQGATVIRGLFTSVIRDLDDPALQGQLSSHAESFGLSSDWYFQNRNYRLMAQVAGTQVSGDPVVIERLQRSSARYFQRPDREQGSNGLFTDAYDPTLSVMRGWGTYTRFSREQGSLLWEVAANVRTPGFENNDIAALSRADYVWMNANIFPQFTRPTSWYRSMFFIVGGQQQYNFDGDLTDRQGQIFAYIQPPNYWNINAFWIRRTEVDDDRLTRGGPVVRRPGFDYFQLSLSTDGRKPIVFSTNPSYGRGFHDTRSWSADLSATWRPASNISLSLGPAYGYDETESQFVTSLADAEAADFYGRRYVFAGLTQRSVSMNTRVNVTFTPNLTLELFAQPFIASGAYYAYKEFAAPRSADVLTYGTDIGTIAAAETTSGTQYTIDPDGTGPAAAFQVNDPSFTFRSLRGNAVLRWEYTPGSTLFFVWTRQSATSLGFGDLDLSRDASALFEGPATNIFLIKVNYRLGF